MIKIVRAGISVSVAYYVSFVKVCETAPEGKMLLYFVA